MKEKEFCETCRKNIAYTVHKRKVISKLNNTDVKYVEKYATCNNCGEEVFVSKLNDINLLEMQKQYRIANKIISKKEIEKLCESLDTDKRSLSKLLGWKETLLEDYCSGKYLPTIKNSNLLKEMYKKKNRIAFFLDGTYIYVEELLVYDPGLMDWLFTCCDIEGKRYLVLADPLKIGRYIIIQPKNSDLLSMIEGKIKMRDICKTVSSFWEVYINYENTAKDSVKKKSIDKMDYFVVPLESEYYHILDSSVKKYCRKLKNNCN